MVLLKGPELVLLGLGVFSEALGFMVGIVEGGLVGDPWM